MKKCLQNLGLSLASIIIIFVILEIGVRLTSPFPFFSSHYPVGLGYNLLETSVPNIFDAELGYKISPNWNHPSHPNFGNSSFSTYDDGTRSNHPYVEKPSTSPPYFDPEKAIVAVGDSFTHGAEVGNTETWPAVLERLSGRRVINGGVGGYSIVQAGLMGERLVSKYKLKKLILSFIPNDVDRSEHYIYSGVQSPYFKETKSGFILYDEHIKNFTKIGKGQKEKLRKIHEKIRRSFLLMEILNRVSDTTGWFVYFGGHRRAHQKGAESGCVLMERLAQMSKKYNVKVVVLLQYPAYYITNLIEEFDPWRIENFNQSKDILACAEEQGFLTLDLYEPLRDLFNNHPNTFESYYVGKNRHMSGKGNEFIATKLYNELLSKL